MPGYDRHFAICEDFGIEMIPVPLTDDGPDLALVEQLVRDDASIKGMWCVPKYSNPTGTVYAAATVERLAAMPAAAPDFRLFWDDAYAVHHLTAERATIPSLVDLCARHGHPDRAFVFGSTSKITLAGAGVALFARFTGQRRVVPRPHGQAHHRRRQGEPAPPRPRTCATPPGCWR